MLRMTFRLRSSIGIALVALLAAACAPAAPPSPTAAPAKPAPTAAPAKPAEKPTAAPAPTQAPAAKPTEAPAAKPAEKPAAKRPTTPAEIFTYTGPDRQQILEEGARREGKVLWYTSLIVNERARPLADAFRQKYPFIQVDIVRLEGNQVVARVVEEYRANRHDVDIYEQSYPAITGLRQAQTLGRFSSPMLEGIPREVRDPEGYFAADRENPLGLAFNTKLVPEAEAPKTYDDLLDPKWKGKLSTQDTSQAIQYVGAMLKIKGEEYLRKLTQQDVTVHSTSARAVTDLVIAGEVPMTAPSSVGHVVVSRKQGGPVGWSPLDQAPTALGYVAVAARASHPHAAALWLDFMLSDDGQRAMVATGEGGTRAGIQADYGDYKDFKKFYTDLSVPMDQYQSEFRKWTDLHKALFVKRAG